MHRGRPASTIVSASAASSSHTNEHVVMEQNVFLFNGDKASPASVTASKGVGYGT